MLSTSVHPVHALSPQSAMAAGGQYAAGESRLRTKSDSLISLASSLCRTAHGWRATHLELIVWRNSVAKLVNKVENSLSP